MGNGPRLIVDIETSPLSLDDLEKAAAKAVASFGRPNFIYMGAPIITTWYPNPQYESTPWASRDRLTKREHKVATLHTFLSKLGALKNITEDEFETIKKLSIKRLKRAKWAEYQQKKVQSPG